MLRWNDLARALGRSSTATQPGARAASLEIPSLMQFDSTSVPGDEAAAEPSSVLRREPAEPAPSSHEPFSTLRSYPPPNAEGLTENDLDIVFQPIVSVMTRRVFAYEALTRCRWPSLSNPEVLFRRASEEACCGPLGRIVRAAAVLSSVPAAASAASLASSVASTASATRVKAAARVSRLRSNVFVITYLPRAVPPRGWAGQGGGGGGRGWGRRTTPSWWPLQ